MSSNDLTDNDNITLGLNTVIIIDDRSYYCQFVCV